MKKFIDLVKNWIKINGEKISVAKYLCSALLVLLVFYNNPSKKYLLSCLLELMAIAVLTDIILYKSSFGKVINSLLLLLFNIQILVLYFGSSFITLIMLTNIDSLQDLSGNFWAYFIGGIFLIVISFLPVSKMNFGLVKDLFVLSLLLALELGLVLFFGNEYSPFYAYVDLGRQQYGIVQQKKKYNAKKNMTKNFYQDIIYDSYKKPDSLTTKPNVVYIMTEGLSQAIIEDEREIMPNVAKWEKKSINFTNYYNHTFATYRGIIGQLYSGYQLDNLDDNTLVSAQSIFKQEGYHTTFINTEPNNAQFSEYLERLKFDEVLGNPGEKYHGEIGSLSDGEAYEALFETIVKEHKNGKPFFTAIYTFGTHASFDSGEEVYGDGKDAMLNKFYNLDCQFAKFMKKFMKSELANDTIIVFTTDHATYADKYYNSSFSEHRRIHPSIDRIPFFIYHKDIESQQIDVSGRNSLDAVPTLMDYLDISRPNFFLGVSMFLVKENDNNFDTVYQAETDVYSTENGNITSLSESRMKIFQTNLDKYFIAKQQKPYSQ